MTEREIEAYLHRRVREAGGDYRRTEWIGRANGPDDRIMLPGNCFWAECKAPGKKPSEAQLREHARMRELGETVHVLDSFEAVDKALAP